MDTFDLNEEAPKRNANGEREVEIDEDEDDELLNELEGNLEYRIALAEEVSRRRSEYVLCNVLPCPGL